MCDVQNVERIKFDNVKLADMVFNSQQVFGKHIGLKFPLPLHKCYPYLMLILNEFIPLLAFQKNETVHVCNTYYILQSVLNYRLQITSSFFNINMEGSERDCHSY